MAYLLDAVDRVRLGEKGDIGSVPDGDRSGPVLVRREDRDIVSACRDTSVRIDELLDFLESTRGSRNIFDMFEVVENMLEVSLKSLELVDFLCPDARRKRPVIPDVMELLEPMESARGTCTTKLDVTGVREAIDLG